MKVRLKTYDFTFEGFNNMKAIHAVALVSLVSALAAGCKPAPAPAAPPPAAAAPAATAPAVLSVSKSVSIDAPLADVWAKVKDFGALNAWHPAVAKDEIVEGKNNETGAVRLLTLGDGGTVKEKLLAIDEAAHSMQYAIVEGVLPVSDYTSTLAVQSDGDTKSTVTWSGSFKRKDTGATPAENANDKAATDTISSVYTGGLDNLKKILETKK